MAELFAHQHEALAVARHRNVMLCSTQPVGKTFLAAMRICEWLSASNDVADTAVAVVIAPTSAMRSILFSEITRLCSVLVWSSDAAGASATDTALVQQFSLTMATAETRVRVALVSPRFFQAALRSGSLSAAKIGLLVLENANDIHETAPSLFRQLFEAQAAQELRIFATAAANVSALVWDPLSNPLYRHIHLLSMVPVFDTTTQLVLRQQACPRLPPLLYEAFATNTNTDTNRLCSDLPCPVRDFLLGKNDKKWDFVRVFRAQLEMGNSAAVHDDKKKQERVNRFLSEAEAVYDHLGHYCLLKFVELELQSNLHACVVEDTDNINHRRRRQRVASGKTSDSLASVDVDDDEDDDDGDERLAQGLQELVDAAAASLDAAKMAKIKAILKMLEWLAATAATLGTNAATPRLHKVARILRSRLVARDPSSTTAPRCWVFVERRAHCSVVAEYLSMALADLGTPPCCSMLGSSNARIVGSLHFSSYLKVITMFTNGGTHVLVTTSIAKKSQRARVEPPPCDLVVVMDELLEADKLLDYCERADTMHGVVKYVLPQHPKEVNKFHVLTKKLKDLLQLDAATPVEAESLVYDAPTTANTRVASIPTPTPAPTPAPATATRPLVPPVSTTLPPPPPPKSKMMPTPPPTVASPPGRSTMTRRAQAPVSVSVAAPVPVPVPPAPVYEIIYKDTGAVLNLSNSVDILSRFCDTLPGLDTYDRRPQYNVTRHPVGGIGMAASLKQAKKKRLKYNCSLDDKIDDIIAAAENQDSTAPKTDDRFLFSAKLRLPMMIGAKKEIGSPRVRSDTEAKAIVAFKGCQELLKRGLVDRRFESTLEPEEPPPKRTGKDTTNGTQDAKSTTYEHEKLADMSAQNSYDLPPTSAEHLGLVTVKSLLAQFADPDATPEVVRSTVMVSMCFYGIHGVQFAILSSKALYTGNTNTGWRYDFATSDVMEPTVNRVTLAQHPTMVTLTKQQLEELLKFHLIIMRLACMKVDDAAREMDVADGGVWKQFADGNDKGYLVVPSCAAADGTLALDWPYVEHIVSQPLLVKSCWPLPTTPVDEWVCVPWHRRNVCYVVKKVTMETAGERIKPMAESDQSWTSHFKAKSLSGVPIFGRWHKRDDVKAADPAQPLLHVVQVPEIVPLIRRVMQRNHDAASVAQPKTTYQERYCLPQFTSRLRVTTTQYFQAMGIVPLLYEFERKCQMSNLMKHVGLELNLALLDDATTKPAYERLEILGDTFLKLETSWYLYEHRRDIREEGLLTQLRRDIIRNDRLTMFALQHELHRYIWYPAAVEQHPFKYWKPSCIGDAPELLVVPAKWIADVLEAVCGAYLVDHGEAGARHLLHWVGVTVPSSPHVFATQYYPDCFPNARDLPPSELPKQRAIGFSVAHRDDEVRTRLVAMQQRLQYTFSNKLLLLEALTHPSAGGLLLTIEEEGMEEGRGGGGGGGRRQVHWRGNYERLEYLGDAVIEYLTLSYAFTTYGSWLPGSLSQWKSATVSNDALGKTAIRCFGVDECLVAGALQIDRESLATVQRIARTYTRDAGPPVKLPPSSSLTTVTTPSTRKKTLTTVNALGLPKLFADVFEALVAAVFLDSGHNLQVVRDVFLGPLLEVVGKDAVAYVCRESGLPLPDEEVDANDSDNRWVLGADEEEDEEDDQLEDAMRVFG